MTYSLREYLTDGLSNPAAHARPGATVAARSKSFAAAALLSPTIGGFPIHSLLLAPMPTTRPPLPLADYQRIFRVLKTVFDSAAADTARADVFFSIAGAHIVEEVYKKRCQPIAGGAFYRLDDSAASVLTLADKDAGNDSLSSGSGFHCWLLCEGYIIDFFAPLFRESLQAGGVANACTRRMFQKPLPAMADSRLLMQAPGDFYLLPNVALTRRTLGEFFAIEANADAVGICAQWYRKPPKEIPREVAVQRGDGTNMPLTLTDMAVTGAW